MHKTRDTLKMLSKQAADSFLKSGGKSTLKAELKKIAAAERLAPVQIPVLTGEANQLTWKALYDMDKKASYSFVPVNPDEVVGDLQAAAPVLMKQASEDYFTAPEGSSALKKEASGSWSAYLPTNGHQKLAADKRSLKHELQNRLEKTAALSERIQDELIKLCSDIEALEIKFIKEARQMLIEIPFAERGEGLQKIAEFVRSAMEPKKDAPALPEKKKKRAALLIAKIAHVMTTQGLYKFAEQQAPESLINYDLPAKIINGNHSLYITINTLGGKWDEEEHMRSNRGIVDATLPQLKEKIRGL
jgi:hypothetical protein